MAYEWPRTEAELLAGHDPSKERERAEELLADVIDEVRRSHKNATVASETVPGNAPHALAEAAKDADLLVVGSHGHSRLHHVVLGSVSEGCIRHAHCPVVVVPTPHPQPAKGADLVRTAGA